MALNLAYAIPGPTIYRGRLRHLLLSEHATEGRANFRPNLRSSREKSLQFKAGNGRGRLFVEPRLHGCGRFVHRQVRVQKDIDNGRDAIDWIHPERARACTINSATPVSTACFLTAFEEWNAMLPQKRIEEYGKRLQRSSPQHEVLNDLVLLAVRRRPFH
jgi:hypothetical protein